MTTNVWIVFYDDPTFDAANRTQIDSVWNDPDLAAMRKLALRIEGHAARHCLRAVRTEPTPIDGPVVR